MRFSEPGEQPFLFLAPAASCMWAENTGPYFSVCCCFSHLDVSASHTSSTVPSHNLSCFSFDHSTLSSGFLRLPTSPSCYYTEQLVTWWVLPAVCLFPVCEQLGAGPRAPGSAQPRNKPGHKPWVSYPRVPLNSHGALSQSLWTRTMNKPDLGSAPSEPTG